MSTDRSFNSFPTILSSVSEDLPQKEKLPHRNGAVSYNILSYARMADYVWVAVGNKICGKCDSTMHSSSCKKVCAKAHTRAERGCRQATSTLRASAHQRLFLFDRK